MRYGFLFAAILAFSGWAGEAVACSCGRAANAAEAMSYASTIFWGRVTATETNDDHKRMRVQAWTGKGWVPVTIRTELNSASCGVDLAHDKVMLIGADRTENGLETNLCLMFAISNHQDEIASILKGCKPFGACP